jgi:hypothetical protein
MLKIKSLILNVPNLHAIVHEQACDPILRYQAQLDVGHANLAEGKDLFQAITPTLDVVDINMRITCIGEET